MKLTVEQAIERAFNNCNLSENESINIYEEIRKFNVLKELPKEEIEIIYNQIAERLGFMNWKHNKLCNSINYIAGIK